MNRLPLRLFCCGFVLLSVAPFQISHAQSPIPKKGVSAPKSAAQPVWKLDALPIAALPQVPVEFEFVGTQRDLLGVVQAVARGISTADAKPASPTTNKAAQLFSDADLMLMVRDIQFLRAQSFNFLKMEDLQDAARAKAASPPQIPQTMENHSPFPKRPERPKRVDVQEFYAKHFRAQKGQRQLFSNSGDGDSDGRNTTISIWIFESPRSWALVTQGPTRAIVVRADGFPRLEPIGRLFRMIVSQ